MDWYKMVRAWLTDRKRLKKNTGMIILVNHTSTAQWVFSFCISLIWKSKWLLMKVRLQGTFGALKNVTYDKDKKAFKKCTSAKHCQTVAYSGKEIVIRGIPGAWLLVGAGDRCSLNSRQTFHCLQWKPDWGLDSEIRGRSFSPMVKRQAEL